MDLKPDAVVGNKYRILRKLHESSSGAVYLASHVSTERRVTLDIKLACRGAAPCDSTLARGGSAPGDLLPRASTPRSLAEEARASVVPSRASDHVAHRGLVEPLDTGTDGAQAWVALDLMRGETLARRLESGPLEPAELRFVFSRLLEILGAVHCAGIVHGHLSPERVFLEETAAGTARVRLLDFEVAPRANKLLGTYTSASTAVVVPRAYRAPEQCADDAGVDTSSDVFALGAVLFACLSAQRPLDLARLAARTANSAGELPLELADSLLAPYAAVAGHCLAFEPERRPSSCEDLRRLLEMGGSRPPPLPRPVVVAPAPVQRKPARSRLGLGSLLFAGVALVLFLRRADSAPPAREQPASAATRSRETAPGEPIFASTEQRTRFDMMRPRVSWPASSATRGRTASPAASLARGTAARFEAPRPGRVERSYRLDAEGSAITRTDDSPSPDSGASNRHVREALRRSAAQLERCYEAARRASLDAQLRALGLAAKIVVEPSGETSAVLLEGDAPDELIECIRGAVQKWKLPATGSSAAYRVPLNFSGAGRVN